MGPRTRKLALTVHVVSSVGWIGGIAAFLALAIVAVSREDPASVRAAWIAMSVVTWTVIVPSSLASLATGLVSSLGTTWGLFRHYWVIAKLVINLFAVTVLLLYTETVEGMHGLATQPALNETERMLLQSPTGVLHAGVALLVLVVAVVLAIYKPRGMTAYGRRRQQARS